METEWKLSNSLCKLRKVFMEHHYRKILSDLSQTCLEVYTFWQHRCQRGPSGLQPVTRGKATKAAVPSYSRLRRLREEEVTVRCERPSALAPADRPQESQSPWCTGICWAPSPIAGLSPFHMSAWPRKAQKRRSWGDLGTRSGCYPSWEPWQF